MEKLGKSTDELLVKRTLSDQIYEHLEQDILTQRIGFGEKLINRELQKKFGVSSTPVRDAINRLYQDGLIDEITNVGARVITFDLQFTLEVNEMISVLNSAAIKMVAHEGNMELLCQKLEKILLQQEYVEGVDDYILLDRNFHEAFFDLSGNAQCIKIYKQYSVLMEMLVRFFLIADEQQKNAISQHKKIFEACRLNNITLIQQCIEDHYSYAKNWFVSIFEKK